MPHESPCRFGQNHLPVPSDVIAVAVTDEDALVARLRVSGIQPEPQPGQEDSTAVIMQFERQHGTESKSSGSLETTPGMSPGARAIRPRPDRECSVLPDRQ